MTPRWSVVRQEVYGTVVGAMRWQGAENLFQVQVLQQDTRQVLELLRDNRLWGDGNLSILKTVT